MTSSVPAAPLDIQAILDRVCRDHLWDAKVLVLRFRNNKDIKLSPDGQKAFLEAGVLEYACGVLCVSEMFHDLLSKTTVTGLSEKFRNPNKFILTGGETQASEAANANNVVEIDDPAPSGVRRSSRNPATKRARAKPVYDIEATPEHVSLEDLDPDSAPFMAPPSEVELLADGLQPNAEGFFSEYQLTTLVAGSA